MRFIARKMFGENTRMAFETLRDHKVRSLLTVVGVVVAVIVLVIVFSVMYGVDKDMRAYLEDFGTDTLFIFKFEPGIHIGRLSQEERTRKPLAFEDAEAIMEEDAHVRGVCVEIQPFDFTPGPPRWVPTAKVGSKEVFEIGFEGATPSYESVQNAHMFQGRFFNDVENMHSADVTVLGYDLADTLFPGHNALDKQVQVGGQFYTVVGVLEKRKGVFLRDNTADKEVIIPYKTFRKHRPQYKENFLTAQAFPGMKSQAEDEIRGTLRRRRGDPYSKPDSFGISSAEAIATQFRSIMMTV